MLRMLLAASNMVTAFILAILTIIVLGLNYPPVISTSLRWGRVAKDFITGSGLSPTYNIWLEFFLQEQQLVFIGYTILMRVLLSSLYYGGQRLRARIWPIH